MLDIVGQAVLIVFIKLAHISLTHPSPFFFLEIFFELFTWQTVVQLPDTRQRSFDICAPLMSLVNQFGMSVKGFYNKLTKDSYEHPVLI